MPLLLEDRQRPTKTGALSEFLRALSCSQHTEANIKSTEASQVYQFQASAKVGQAVTGILLGIHIITTIMTLEP